MTLNYNSISLTLLQVRLATRTSFTFDCTRLNELGNRVKYKDGNSELR